MHENTDCFWYFKWSWISVSSTLKVTDMNMMQVGTKLQFQWLLPDGNSFQMVLNLCYTTSDMYPNDPFWKTGHSRKECLLVYLNIHSL